MFRNIFITIFLLFILFSVSFSLENNSQDNKAIAFIDRFTLEDGETGIKEISNTYQLMYADGCFSPISQLAYKLQEKNLSEEKRKQLEILLKKYIEEAKTIHENREKALLDPVYSKIFDSIKSIESKNNLKILFSDELYLNKNILFFDDDLDISNIFIKTFNTKTKDFNNFILEIPQSKIALLNTEIFYDKESGIIGLQSEYRKIENTLNKSNDLLSESEKNLQKDYSKYLAKIGKEIKDFSKMKGFNVAFDSSTKLPQELKNVDSQDITDEFIKHFNTKYP